MESLEAPRSRPPLRKSFVPRMRMACDRFFSARRTLAYALCAGFFFTLATPASMFRHETPTIELDMNDRGESLMKHVVSLNGSTLTSQYGLIVEHDRPFGILLHFAKRRRQLVDLWIYNYEEPGLTNHIEIFDPENPDRRVALDNYFDHAEHAISLSSFARSRAIRIQYEALWKGREVTHVLDSLKIRFYYAPSASLKYVLTALLIQGVWTLFYSLFHPRPRPFVLSWCLIVVLQMLWWMSGWAGSVFVACALVIVGGHVLADKLIPKGVAGNPEAAR